MSPKIKRSKVGRSREAGGWAAQQPWAWGVLLVSEGRASWGGCSIEDSVVFSGGADSMEGSVVADSWGVSDGVSVVADSWGDSEGVDSVEASGEVGSEVSSVGSDSWGDSEVDSWLGSEVEAQGKGMGRVFWKTAW